MTHFLKKGRIRASVVLFRCLIAEGCAFFPPSAPQDLHFESIRPVKTKELPDPIRQKILSFPFVPNQDREVLEVVFTSHEDILSYRKNWANAYIPATGCRDWDGLDKLTQSSSGGYVYEGPLRMEASDVYCGDIDILSREARYRNTNCTLTQQMSLFYYNFYIDISRKSEYQPRAEYDLRLHAEDVCFGIQSAEFMRLGARSNVVTIPKTAIIEALAPSAPGSVRKKGL
jgi:hypothetical protein